MKARLVRCSAGLVAALCAAPAVAWCQAPPPPKRVLMLYGHDPHAPGVVKFTNQLHAIARSDSTPRVVFYDELLDLDRFPENARLEELVDYIVEKYRGFSFDAILTDGTRALQFAIERVSARFGGVPIVYGMAFEPEVDFSALPKNVTGIHQLVPFAATLKLARALQPDAERVVLVAGTGRTDSLLLAGAVRDMTPLLDGMQLVVWQDWTYAALLQRMRTLPRRTITILSGFSRDQSGQQFNEGDLIASVTRLASAPVYGIARNWVGDGVVGGVTMDFGDDGLRTGRLLLQVLDRTSGGLPLPPPEVDRPSQVVDWRALERWELSERRLPPGTEVLFRTPTVWERYKGYILASLVLLIAQSALIAGLFIQRVRRHHAEVELRRSQDSLHTSFERIRHLGSRLLTAQETERSRIAGELHDDINQQLALLTMDLDQVEVADPDDVKRLASEARARTQEISRNVRDLSHSLYPAKLRLVGLVAALQTLRFELSHSGIAVAFTYDNVPSTLPPGVTLCLFRVAQEALHNAINHSQAREVAVHLAGGPVGLTLSVVDEGVGFDCEVMWTKGLGLVSMKERLEAIGGALDIRSGPGSGTRVEATVPVDVIQSGEATRPHRSTAGPFEPPRVLLVDDNEAILARARAVLAPACVVVGTATDGPSALQAAEALRPDVIVLDISMPHMTGFEVAAKLRQSGSTAAVVFLTVHAEEELFAAMRAVGAIGYVVKPRLVLDLMHAVAQACEGREFVSPLR